VTIIPVAISKAFHGAELNLTGGDELSQILEYPIRLQLIYSVVKVAIVGLSGAACSATRSRRSARPEGVTKDRKFADSPLEQAGFELPVPPARAHGAAGGRRRRRRWGMSRLLLFFDGLLARCL
jgi:hypothetical protein